MKIILVSIGSLLFTCKVFAASIVWNQAFIDYDYYNTNEKADLYHFPVDNSGLGYAGFALGINFVYNYNGNVPMGVFITPDSDGGLVYAVNIREMEVGDIVSETTLRGDQSYFYSNWIDAEPGYDGGSPVTSTRYIPNGEEIYMGFLVKDWRDGYYYGWLSLIFDGTEVRVEQSAVETSGGPIIIQPRNIPEPGVAALLAVGAAMLLAGRRRGIMESSQEKEPVACRR